MHRLRPQAVPFLSRELLELELEDLGDGRGCVRAHVVHRDRPAELAMKHGASAEEDTDEPAVAYARFPRSESVAFRKEWLDR